VINDEEEVFIVNLKVELEQSKEPLILPADQKQPLYA
jgi:hypothetical protein